MAKPTDWDKLNAAWSRLVVWNNVAMPLVVGRIIKLTGKLK